MLPCCCLLSQTSGCIDIGGLSTPVFWGGVSCDVIKVGTLQGGWVMVFAPTVFHCIHFSIHSPAEPSVKQQLLQGGIFREFGQQGSRVARDGEKKIKERKEIQIRRKDSKRKKKGCSEVRGN